MSQVASCSTHSPPQTPPGAPVPCRAETRNRAAGPCRNGPGPGLLARPSWLVALACLGSILWWPLSVNAQPERYELGKRLRRLEEAWQVATPERRAAAVRPMDIAVRSFFGLQLARAGQGLDEAWYAVRSPDEPTPLTRFLISHQPQLRPLVSSLSDQKLQLRLVPFYEMAPQPLSDCSVICDWIDSAGATRLTERMSWDQALAGQTLDLQQLTAGDWTVRIRIESGAGAVPLPDLTHSRIRDFESRPAQLDQSFQQQREKLPATVRATLGELLQRLQSLQAGEVPEADFPADRWLSQAEQLLQRGDQPGDWFAAAARQADLWMTLGQERKRTAIRVRAPAAANGPLPVLFLFHGAGGSENMFFETYGAGLAVSGGLERGWLVVAPRQGVLGMGMDVAAMVEELAVHFPVDRKRIMLMGHSMGAGQVVRQTGLHPGLPIAAVAIGGGARPARPESLGGIRWFVSAGQYDFGKGGAAALARSLEQAGCPVEYQEIPDVEHMVVVQASLPEVFRFLDDCCSRVQEDPR